MTNENQITRGTQQRGNSQVGIQWIAENTETAELESNETAKNEMKLYADRQRRSKSSKIEEGNAVLVRNKKKASCKHHFTSGQLPAKKAH
jgi:hypothetical protein